MNSPVAGDFLLTSQSAIVRGFWAELKGQPALTSLTKPTKYCRWRSFTVYLPQTGSNVKSF
jgi:hypothetical protein